MGAAAAPLAVRGLESAAKVALELQQPDLATKQSRIAVFALGGSKPGMTGAPRGAGGSPEGTNPEEEAP